jgi:hypothetical protein
MKMYTDLGCAPANEDCAQVGSPDYARRARRECRAYIRQLRRMFGKEPDGAQLDIRANPHDFGTYYSVVCYYHPVKPASEDYAWRCESESPQHWDDQARQELAGERR